MVGKKNVLKIANITMSKNSALGLHSVLNVELIDLNIIGNAREQNRSTKIIIHTVLKFCLISVFFLQFWGCLESSQFLPDFKIIFCTR